MIGTTTMTLHRIDGERRTHVRPGDETAQSAVLANRFAGNPGVHRVTVTRDLGPVSVLTHDTSPMHPVTAARRDIEVFAAGVFAWGDGDDAERLGAALKVVSAWEEGPFAWCYPSRAIRVNAARVLLGFLWSSPTLTRAIVRVVSSIIV